MTITSQVHCLLMQLMVGCIKMRKFCTSEYLLRAEVHNLFGCYGSLTRGHHFNDFAKSHQNLTYQTDYQSKMFVSI